ncbi:MAG: hypothetical protein KKD31_07585 [Bacteroidetes bacterium]|nr:hypothetical protein [Bacteroidota bacterium]
MFGLLNNLKATSFFSHSILIYSLVIVLGGCSYSPNEELLAGEYVFTQNYFYDSLWLDQNHKYIHVFYSGDSLELRNENRGIWEYDRFMSEIVFHDFIMSGESDHSPGRWIARVRLQAEEVRIFYAEEHGIFFRKIK